MSADPAKMPTSSKTYKYAVVASTGTYGSGSSVRTAYRTDDLAKAQAKAKAMTRSYQRAMTPHGGSSGFYRVILWESAGTTIQGYDLDRTPTAS